MRCCCLCGVQDYPVIQPDHCNCKGGDDLAGHATGCRAIQHFVTKDIKKHKKKSPNDPIPLALRKQGYSDAGIFQGLTAIERLLCRTCIRKQDEVIEIEQYKLKCGQEAESTTEMNYHQILCS